MRQFTAVVLLLVYVGLASGISLHFHYCSGNMKSVSLLGSIDSCCGETSCCDKSIAGACCNADMHESCCDDTYLRLGSETPYARPELFIPAYFFPDEPVSLLFNAENNSAGSSVESCSGPVLKSSPPPYIAFSSLKYCA